MLVLFKFKPLSQMNMLFWYAASGVGPWAYIMNIMNTISHINIRGVVSAMSHVYQPWLRHQMETFTVLLAICAGNSPVTGEFPAQRPVTRSFSVFFDRRLNKGLSKQ